MTTHRLKSWPEFFRAVASGAKTFEVRHNDRAYAVGDVLRLGEWDPSIPSFTGREIDVRVTYLSDLGAIGVPGFVGMSVELVEAA